MIQFSRFFYIPEGANDKRKKKKERKIYLPINKLQIVIQPPVRLNECNDIRKMLNKKYLDKVPSKAAQS